jgi:hypothetical protein
MLVLSSASTREPVQDSRIVREMHAQPHQAHIFHEPTLDNARKQSHVDVAAGNNYHHFFRRYPSFPEQECGERCGSLALREKFFPLKSTSTALAISSSSTVTISSTASQVSANHGWCSSRETNCCPIIPVAPRIPTSIFVVTPLTPSWPSTHAEAPRHSPPKIPRRC